MDRHENRLIERIIQINTNDNAVWACWRVNDEYRLFKFFWDSCQNALRDAVLAFEIIEIRKDAVDMTTSDVHRQIRTAGVDQTRRCPF